MQNEILLRVIARVDFDLETMINLRLVELQLHDLLTDAASLIQLRTDTSDIQYPSANSLLHASCNHTWDSLQDLKDDRMSVLRIMKCMQQPDSESDRLPCRTPESTRNQGLPPGRTFFVVRKQSGHVRDGIEGLEDLLAELTIN